MARSRGNKANDTSNKKAAPKPTSELAETIKAVGKTFGEGTIRMSKEVRQPTRIPSGIFVLDMSTLGGQCHGRSSMILAEKHGGKTTLASKFIRSFQLMYPDQVAAMIDIEGTFDTVWAAKNGVDPDRLYITECEIGEQAVDVFDALCRTIEVGWLGLDSLAMIQPFKEQEASSSDHHIGLQARLIGKLVRKVTSNRTAEYKRGHEVCTTFINQYRTDAMKMFGDKRIVPGGRTVEHLMTSTFALANKEIAGKVGGIDMITHNEQTLNTTKHKANSRIKTAEFKINRSTDHQWLREGMCDDGRTMLAFAKNMGFHSGAGKSQKIEVGDCIVPFASQDTFAQILYEDPDLYWSLRCNLIAAHAISQGFKGEFIEQIFAQPNLFLHDLENNYLDDL